MFEALADAYTMNNLEQDKDIIVDVSQMLHHAERLEER